MIDPELPQELQQSLAILEKIGQRPLGAGYPERIRYEILAGAAKTTKDLNPAHGIVYLHSLGIFHYSPGDEDTIRKNFQSLFQTGTVSATTGGPELVYLQVRDTNPSQVVLSTYQQRLKGTLMNRIISGSVPIHDMVVTKPGLRELLIHLDSNGKRFNIAQHLTGAIQEAINHS